MLRFMGSQRVGEGLRRRLAGCPMGAGGGEAAPPATSPGSGSGILYCWTTREAPCIREFSSVQFSHSVVSDSLRPLNRSTPGLPVYHQLSEFTQTHVH